MTTAPSTNSMTLKMTAQSLDYKELVATDTTNSALNGSISSS
jgi:hypothetical protein